MDGTWQRAAVEGDRGRNKSARSRGYLDGRPAGFIQDFKTGYAEA
jgi:putative DNA primase/helicase